jgi:hypothetical protein
MLGRPPRCLYHPVSLTLEEFFFFFPLKSEKKKPSQLCDIQISLYGFLINKAVIHNKQSSNPACKQALARDVN